jgi:hypothetical protein
LKERQQALANLSTCWAGLVESGVVLIGGDQVVEIYASLGTLSSENPHKPFM